MTFNNIILLEINNPENLYPFSILHPSWEIRCGCLKIYEKYQVMFPQKNLLFQADELLLDSFFIRTGLHNPNVLEGDTLVIFGNVLPTFTLIETLQKAVINNDNNDIVFESNGEIFAFYLKDLENTKNLYLKLSDSQANRLEVSCELVPRINFIWEALDYNSRYIALDFLLLESRLKNIQIDQFQGIHVVTTELIHVGENVRIAPGVVLDASEGEIVIDDGVQIMPNAVVLGPVYIGRDSIVKIGAKIYGNCSFGEKCKIGGELEAVIFQGFSNKQHEGFLGHSFIGEWVNFGADTNNSDLKNTYSSIVMRLPNKRVPTNKMFIGLMAGDHTKTAINSQFTTGTTTGIHCNLFDSGFFPSQLPSYSWGGSKESKMHRLEDALATARIVMARRGKGLTVEESALMKKEFDKSDK